MSFLHDFTIRHVSVVYQQNRNLIFFNICLSSSIQVIEIVINMDHKEFEQSETEIIEERTNKVSNTVLRRYAKRRFLGKGGFARCYEVENL